MDTPRKVITFYSYKGGTGRSMVLANTAWILASLGKRVLVIDWDLEAPGLHRYFHPFLMDPQLTASEGLIDFVVDYQLRTYAPPAWEPRPAAAAPVAEHGQQVVDGATTTLTSNDDVTSTATMEQPAAADSAMKKHAERILRCLQSLEWKFPGEGTLDFIPAGQQGPGYAARVNSFNWGDFYRDHRGEELFHAVRELLVEDYQYVLIDSRTGVSDTSGICTVQMPDTVVVCFTLNNQGIEGASGIARSILDQRRDRPVDIFPVPMRVENAEKEKVESRKVFAQRQFERIHFALPNGESRAEYWSNVLFPYVPFYAYEEILATFGDRQADATSLLAPALRLAGYLTGGRDLSFSPPSEEVRAEILAKYARDSAVVVEWTPAGRASEAEDVYLRLSPEEKDAAYRVFTRLVQVAEPEEGSDLWVQVPLALLDEEERRVARQFHGSALLVGAREGGGEVVQTADENLLGTWRRLAEWTVEDRDFLLWRRRLSTSLSEWVSRERDESDLLTGTRLAAARRWAAKRGDRLTARESDFIKKSVARHERKQRSLMMQQAGVVLLVALLVVLSILAYTSTRASARRSREAREQYEHSLDSLRIATLLRSGTDNSQVGNYGRAIEDFQAAIAIDSTNSQAFLGLGNVSYQQGDFATSVSALSQAVQRSPDNWRAYDLRARAYLRTGDTTRAVSDLQQVVELAPDTVGVARRSLLTQISATRVPVDSTVRVNIRYRSRQDQAVARQVQRELGRAGLTVLTVEYREEDSTSPVRYFFPEDQRQAELVARRVEAALQEVDIETSITAQQFQNFRNLPRGRIEVWLPVFTVDAQSQGPRPDSSERRPGNFR